MFLKTAELVPTFQENRADSDNPHFLPRSACRIAKKNGEGYFINQGRTFLWISKQVNWEEVAKRYEFRDESACIQEPTMFAFVLGERRAVAAVNAWQ